MTEILNNLTKECNQGTHNLIEVYCNPIDSSLEHSVKWCSICGAIVVDAVIDGCRTYAGDIKKMKLPLITQKIKSKD